YGLVLSQKYQRAIAAFPGATKILDQACTTDVLLRSKDALAQLLVNDPHWELVRSDRLSVTYQRRSRAPGCDAYPIPRLKGSQYFARRDCSALASARPGPASRARMSIRSRSSSLKSLRPMTRPAMHPPSTSTGPTIKASVRAPATPATRPRAKSTGVIRTGSLERRT